jgi:hypothetical protein
MRKGVVGEQKKTKIQNAFDQLLKEAGYGDIPDLVAEIEKSPEPNLISRAQLYNIRKGTRTPKLETLQRLAEALSLRGRVITADIIASRLKLPGAKQEVQGISTYRSSLEEHLQEKLDKIPYIERNLTLAGGREEKGENRTIRDIIDCRQHTLVLGEPGIGKSTLLDKIALEAAKAGRIPVYLDLRFCFKEDVEGFKEELVIQAKAYGGNSTIGLSLVDEGMETLDELVILIDHLDQVNPVYGRIICRLAMTFKGQFMVSCRSQYEMHYLDLVGKGFQSARLQGLSEVQVDSIFTKQGFSLSSYDSAQQESILALGQNPFHLEMLFSALREPEVAALTTRTQLFLAFITEITKGSHTSRQKKIPVGLKSNALGSLAFAMLDRADGTVMQRAWAEDHLHRFIAAAREQYLIDDSDAVIEEILADGLLRIDASGVYYLFAHDTLRSFFCAWHLAHNIPPDKAQAIILEQTRNEVIIYSQEWEEIIVHYAGLMDNVSGIIRSLMDETYDDIFRFNLMLAGKCVNEANLSIISQVGEECMLRFLEDIRDGRRSPKFVKNGIQAVSLPNNWEIFLQVHHKHNKINDSLQEALENLSYLGSEYGLSLFCITDIGDFCGFFSKILQERDKDFPNPGKRIWNLLPLEIQSLIENASLDTFPSEEDESKILNALTDLLERRDFYQEQDYVNTNLPEEAKELLLCNRNALSTSEKQRISRRLNRILIHAAYPEEISLTPKYKYKKTMVEYVERKNQEDFDERDRHKDREVALAIIDSISHHDLKIRRKGLTQWRPILSSPKLFKPGIPEKYAIISKETEKLIGMNLIEIVNTVGEEIRSPCEEIRDRAINALLHFPWEEGGVFLLELLSAEEGMHISRERLEEIIIDWYHDMKYTDDLLRDIITQTRLKVSLMKVRAHYDAPLHV